MAKPQKERCIDQLSLGAAVHTAFRKGSYHPNAGRIWQLIHDMPKKEWGNVVDFIWECMWEGRDADRHT